MKNRIDELSDDDYMRLCRYIGVEKLKKGIKKNPAAKPGLSVNSMTVDQTVEFYQKNRKEDYIRETVEKWAYKMTKGVEKLKNAEIENGSGEKGAYVHALMGNRLYKDPDLYFKLAETGMSEPQIEEICNSTVTIDKQLNEMIIRILDNNCSESN